MRRVSAHSGRAGADPSGFENCQRRQKIYTRGFLTPREITSRQGYSTGPAIAGLAPEREETMEDLAPFFIGRWR
jgi:hypothetical protein